MYVGLYELTPPASEPVSLDLARQHCRVDHTSDDNLLAVYITAARGLAENYCGRCFVNQQLRYCASDAPPGPQWPLTAVTPVILPLWLPYPLVFQQPILLPRSPVVSVDQVGVSQYGQSGNTILDPTTGAYSFDLQAEPSRLLLSPSSQPALGQVVAVDFTAGYAANSWPAMVDMAILFMVAWFYEHRGDGIDEMPSAAKALLSPYKNVTFG